MNLKQVTTITMLTGALIISLAVSAFALKEPEVLFDVKTDKKIQEIKILGQHGELILIFNDDRIFVHDGNTGKKIWEDKVPGYVDDGLNMVWNSEKYVTSMKKGMRCYDIATGKIDWETQTEVKMKTFRQYVNFKTNFILFFKKQMQSFNPNTGAIAWSNDAFELSGTLEEAGLSNIYQFSRPYGDRLLLLGDKNAYLYDGKDGTLLGTAPVEWNSDLVKMHLKGDDVPEPVSFAGDNMATFFCEEQTSGFDLRTGKVVWTVEEVVDQKRGFLSFEKGASHYLLFGFKKKSMLLNVEEGKIVWETGEDLAMDPVLAQLLDDGTLFYLGYKKSITSKIEPFGVAGSFQIAYGLDFATGKPKWGPSVLAYTRAAAFNMFGMVPQMVTFKGPYPRPDGWLFYVFGMQAAVPEGKYDQKGGEGFVLIDPKTGKIKWRTTGLVMYDNWSKNVVAPKLGNVAPNYYRDEGAAPDPIFEGDAAYIAANNTVVKIDLNSGKPIWQGPEYSFVYSYTVDKGKVFGPIGYAKWNYAANAARGSAEDNITKTKRVGYFVLDAATGKQVFAIEKAKIPLQIHFDQYDAATNSVYLCDGEVLRGLNLNSGKYDWEMNLDKQLNGVISAEDGVIFKNSGVSISSSTSLDGAGGYTITTTTTTTYDISMEHRVIWRGDRILVLAKEGPAMVGVDGKIIWKGEWDWKSTKINFAPTLTDNGIVYQYKKKLTYLSLADGSLIWQTKESGDADFAFDKTGTKIFIIEKKNIAAYKL